VENLWKNHHHFFNKNFLTIFQIRNTLRSHIRAMGGEFEIIARFPDGVVKIANFSEL
jgi:hypothetical protein